MRLEQLCRAQASHARAEASSRTGRGRTALGQLAQGQGPQRLFLFKSVSWQMLLPLFRFVLPFHQATAPSTRSALILPPPFFFFFGGGGGRRVVELLDSALRNHFGGVLRGTIWDVSDRT